MWDNYFVNYELHIHFTKQNQQRCPFKTYYDKRKIRLSGSLFGEKNSSTKGLFTGQRKISLASKRLYPLPLVTNINIFKKMNYFCIFK